MQDYIDTGTVDKDTAMQLCPGCPTLADQHGKLGSLSTRMAGIPRRRERNDRSSGHLSRRVWCESPALGAR